MKNLWEAVSGVYSRIRPFAAFSLKVCSRFVLLAASFTIRIIKITVSWLLNEWKTLRDSSSDKYPYYRHSLPVRIMHWTNAVFLVILLMSGLNIFNAHPALYLGESSYSRDPPVLEMRSERNNAGEITGITRIFGHDFNTTGFFGASEGRTGQLTGRGFPSWLTIPAGQWLAMGRRWHFFFAWLFVLNGFIFVVYSAIGRHLRRDLVPTKQDLRSVGISLADHLRFRRPSGEESRHYNVLQKISYLGLIFFLAPLMILMGLGMSPALNALFPGWVDIFSGRQSVRTLHFIIALTLVLFVAVHLFEVIVNGFWNNLRSMITGYYRVGGKDDTTNENK